MFPPAGRVARINFKSIVLHGKIDFFNSLALPKASIDPSPNHAAGSALGSYEDGPDKDRETIMEVTGSFALDIVL